MGRADPEVVRDDDGLMLLVPPFADALVTSAELYTLSSGAETVDVMLPRAGALFASKVANLFLEGRVPEKRAADGHDAPALLDAFGALALAHDLRAIATNRRHKLADLLEQVGYGGLAAQARVSGFAFPGAQEAVPMIVRTLRSRI